MQKMSFVITKNTDTGYVAFTLLHKFETLF